MGPIGPWVISIGPQIQGPSPRTIAWSNYLQELPLLQKTRILDIKDDNSNNLGIYVEDDEDKDIDELTIYFKGKKRKEKVFPLILKSY
jgi:hypothetical protein